MIIVTTMQHNITVRLEPPPVDDEEEHSEDEAPNPTPSDVRAVLHQAGAQTRQELINLF